MSLGIVREHCKTSLHKQMGVILTQTDTTVGFLSQNSQQLYEIKSRVSTKPFIKVYPSFQDFLNSGNRVPQEQKNRIRRAKKTTFIVKNRAFRIAPTYLHSSVLNRSQWFYSTSANQSGKSFERDFATTKADIIIEDKNGLSENSSSKLIKINSVAKRRLR